MSAESLFEYLAVSLFANFSVSIAFVHYVIIALRLLFSATKFLVSSDLLSQVDKKGNSIIYEMS